MQRSTELRELKKQWERLLSIEPLPEDDQFDIWLALHDAPTVAKAITQLAIKYKKLGGAMERDYVIRFASAVMSRLSREHQQSSITAESTTNTI